MRIITRGDFDGMTSCLLLSLVEEIDDIRFVHPKDVQDGKIEADERDIVVNLPYIPGCGLWFDHHAHRGNDVAEPGTFKGRFEDAPSCARVIVNHYADRAKVFEPYAQLIADTDRLDSAQLDMDDITDPKGGILLGLTLDPRSGLGAEFQRYFRWMVENARTRAISELLECPEVKDRVTRVMEEQEGFRALLEKHSRVDGNVVVVDFRDLATRPIGSRFLIYTMYPQCNVEVRVFKGMPGQTVAAIGHSVFNRTCRVSAGALCSRYGGGGHKGAGTCQFAEADAPRVLAEIIETLKKNEPIG